MMTQYIISLSFLAIAIALAVFYLITLQKLMEAISIENRKMAPSNVWFMFIPLFNVIWHFIMVSRISGSVRDETIKLNIAHRFNQSFYLLGMASMILYVIALILNVFLSIPTIGGLFSLTSMAAWIIFWVQAGNYKKLILANHNNFLFDAERQAQDDPSV